MGDIQNTQYFKACLLYTSMENSQVEAAIVEKTGSGELPVRIYLFQGLPKSDKMELIIQKAVELGVYSVIPTATKNAVVKLDGKKEKSKLDRWQAIAESGACLLYTSC